jgi:hypothetical protein
MKSFNQFINEAEAQQPQRERRRIPKVLSPTTPPPAEVSPNPAGRRTRTKPSAFERDLEAASTPTAPTLTAAQRAAIKKGYRTPTGQQTIRGLETYATRRGAMGYGDAGKNPAQYGVDPRTVSAQSRERTAAAAAGDPVARSGIKSDYKKIDAKYPNPNPTTGFADFSRRATAAANASRPTGVPVVPQTPENTYIRNMQDQGRSVDPKFVELQGVKASGKDKPEMIGQSAPTGQGAEFRRQRAQPKPESPLTRPVAKPVGTGEVTRATAKNDAFRDMENDLMRPTRARGTVGITRKGAPITTSTTRTSTNPAPAPAPQRAVTSAIDQQRQSAADTTPAAVKKQNAAVMNATARTLGKVSTAALGYKTGIERGEQPLGAAVRGVGAAVATDALTSAVYNRLPKPLKTVGAIVTTAASQKGVNSLITTLRQQLGMK